MTKEELEKEAEALYEDWYAHKLGAISIIGVICKMAEPREKRIAELEKENAELKELIKNIIRVTWGEGWNYSLDWKVKAEQFLKDCEVEKL